MMGLCGNDVGVCGNDVGNSGMMYSCFIRLQMQSRLRMQLYYGVAFWHTQSYDAFINSNLNLKGVNIIYIYLCISVLIQSFANNLKI